MVVSVAMTASQVACILVIGEGMEVGSAMVAMRDRTASWC